MKDSSALGKNWCMINVLSFRCLYRFPGSLMWHFTCVTGCYGPRCCLSPVVTVWKNVFRQQDNGLDNGSTTEPSRFSISLLYSYILICHYASRHLLALFPLSLRKNLKATWKCHTANYKFFPVRFGARYEGSSSRKVQKGMPRCL